MTESSHFDCPVRGAGWSGTVAQIRKDFKSGVLVKCLQDGLERRGISPGASEVDSWSASVPLLLESLQDSRFDSLQMVLELFPANGKERIDAVLLGGTADRPRLVVVEFKGWKKAPPKRDRAMMQVVKYLGLLNFYCEAAQGYQQKGIFYCFNMDREELLLIPVEKSADRAEDILAFGKGESDQFAQAIASYLLPNNLSVNEFRKFSNATYIQSPKFLDLIKNRGHQLLGDVAWAFGSCGLGLTEEQQQIEQRVMQALRSEKGSDIIVTAGHGTGKTLLAVYLFLRALEEKHEVAIANQSAHLSRVLRHLLKSLKGADLSKLLYYFSGRPGLAQLNDTFDLVIGDEAQRAESGALKRFLPRARVTVLFLDEYQQLRPNEDGTSTMISDVSSSLERSPEHMRMTVNMRLHGGTAYELWVDNLLEPTPHPEKLYYNENRWHGVYNLEFVNNITDLVGQLKEHRSAHSKVALVASLTESYGSRDHRLSPENTRIGYELESGFDLYRGLDFKIYWAMDDDYVPFWVDGECSDLKLCASTYGAQSFEADWVGVIWGRDVVYRNGKWRLGDPNICFDKTKNRELVRYDNRTRQNEWCDNALNFLFNHYRVFLTRGIRGTYVYCEDAETREFLKSLNIN